MALMVNQEAGRERGSLVYSQPRALLDQNVLALMDTMGGGKGMGERTDRWMDGWQERRIAG